MRYIGFILKGFVVFVLASFLFFGVPEVLTGEYFLHLGVSAAVYITVGGLIELLPAIGIVVVSILAGCLMGSIGGDTELGGAIGALFGGLLTLALCLCLNVTILVLGHKVMPWFPQFTLLQAAIVAIADTTIGMCFTKYKSSSEKGA